MRAAYRAGLDAPPGDDERRIAHNRIFHTPAYPSRLLAPVVRR